MKDQKYEFPFLTLPKKKITSLYLYNKTCCSYLENTINIYPYVIVFKDKYDIFMKVYLSLTIINKLRISEIQLHNVIRTFAM